MPRPLNLLSEKKLLVSPSLLSADFSKLGEEVKAIEKAGADLAHLDVMDAHFVPNLTFGPPVIAALRKHSNLPFDVHLMMTNPLDYIQNFARAGADHITFHIESDSGAEETIRAIHSCGCSAGLTLKPGTGVETLLPFLAGIEMVLIMTVEPGFGGQSFMHGQLEKIRILRAELKKNGLHCHIEVDGGINAVHVRETAAAGANIAVAGTAVFRHPGGLEEGIRELHAAQEFLPD